jgi:hypothetical protein
MLVVEVVLQEIQHIPQALQEVLVEVVLADGL